MNVNYEMLRALLTPDTPILQEHAVWLPVINKKMRGELSLLLSVHPGAIRYTSRFILGNLE